MTASGEVTLRGDMEYEDMVDAWDRVEAPRGSACGHDASGHVVAREERPLGHPPDVQGDECRWGGDGHGGGRDGGQGGTEGHHPIRQRGRKAFHLRVGLYIASASTTKGTAKQGG
jgi:hypothetical protein